MTFSFVCHCIFSFKICTVVVWVCLGVGAIEGRPGYSKPVDFFGEINGNKKKAMANYENITLLQQLKQQ